jgi:hypothetical protein
MELLREYIDIASSSKQSLFEAVALFEDLGNFKKVRPDFIKVFKDSKYIKKAGNEYAQNVFGAGGLRKGVGRNSEFTATQVKTGAAVLDALKQDSALGFVISTGDAVGDQVFAAFFTQKRTDTNGKGESDFDMSNTKLLMVLDRAYLKKHNPETFEKMKSNWDISDGESPIQLYDQPLTMGKARGYITAIVKAIKQADASAKLIIIGSDADRSKKQGERYTAKQGRILTPKEYAQLSEKDLKNYARSFKSALSSRLDKYKTGKAIDVKSAEEFFNTILEKGYIDKIKVNGVTYKYYDTRLNFSKLKDGINDSFYTSAAEYQIVDDERYDWLGGTKTQYQKLEQLADEESGYSALIQRMKDAEAAGEKDTVTDEEKQRVLDEYSKKCPPYRIFVKFKLQGASIVPDSVEFQRR